MFPTVPLDYPTLRHLEPAALRGGGIRGNPHNIDFLDTLFSDMPYRRTHPRSQSSLDLSLPPVPTLGPITLFTNDDKNPHIHDEYPHMSFPRSSNSSHRVHSLLGHVEDERAPSLSWSSYPSPATTSGPPTPHISLELLGRRSLTGHSDDGSVEKRDFLSPLGILSPRCHHEKTSSCPELDPSSIQRPNNPTPDELELKLARQTVRGDTLNHGLGAPQALPSDEQLEIMNYVLEQERHAIMGMFKSGFDDDEDELSVEAQRARLSVIYENSAEEGGVKARRKKSRAQEVVEKVSSLPTLRVPIPIRKPQLPADQESRRSTITHSVYDPYFNLHPESSINIEDECYAVPTSNTPSTETETTSPSGPTTPDSPLARPFIVYEPGTPTRGYFTGMKTLDLSRLPSTPSPAPVDDESPRSESPEVVYIRISNSVLKLQDQVQVEGDISVGNETPKTHSPLSIPSITTIPAPTEDFVDVMDVAVDLVNEELDAAEGQAFQELEEPNNFEDMFFNKLLRRSGGGWKDVVMREARRSWGPQLTTNDIVIPANPATELSSSPWGRSIPRSSTWSNAITPFNIPLSSTRKSRPTSYQDLLASPRFSCSPLSSIEKLNFFDSSRTLFTVNEASTSFDSTSRMEKGTRSSRNKERHEEDKENWGSISKSESASQLHPSFPSVRPLCSAKRNVVISHVPFKPSAGVIEHVPEATWDPSLSLAPVLCSSPILSFSADEAISQDAMDTKRISSATSNTAVSREEKVRFVANVLSKEDNTANDLKHVKHQLRLSVVPSLKLAYEDTDESDRDNSWCSGFSAHKRDSLSSSSHYSDEDIPSESHRKTVSLTLSLPFGKSLSSRPIVNLDIEHDSPEPPNHHPFDLQEFSIAGTSSSTLEEGETGRRSKAMDDILALLDEVCLQECRDSFVRDVYDGEPRAISMPRSDLLNEECTAKLKAREFDGGTPSPVLEHYHAL